ncbi:3-carboxyethylcatechol 2,3-dioxygenase [Sphingobium yanoikuyae]|uniref:3-carboxyethylcatechol 2,3-dioxygenase n=1 Tax=Sphingobium yanoikuyae TaxID=13690 RepID=A0A430BKT8_SPHYA|nr:3-carboxyethylcatechol 2,3-dioxygenase [Sphingobium yanoikuyae]
MCASHTPLLHDGIADDRTKAAVKDGFRQIAQRARDFAPDLIVQFAPDHFNGFFYDLMPSFCVGLAANSVGDWDTHAGPLPVPEELSRSLVEALLHSGVDVAMSYRMIVDHGFVQIWEEMFGVPLALPAPIIPIFVNCAAAPLPTYARARALGEAVGAWALTTGKRVLFAASGGLSHDPPTPDVGTAQETVRERLISGHNPSREVMEARKTFVLEAGLAASKGLPPCQPLNPEWDHEVIELILRGDLRAFDTFDTKEVRRLAGRGANELLPWVAALAAQSQAGAYSANLDFYQAIDGWIAGMTMMSARAAAAHISETTHA